MVSDSSDSDSDSDTSESQESQSEADLEEIDRALELNNPEDELELSGLLSNKGSQSDEIDLESAALVDI